MMSSGILHQRSKSSAEAVCAASSDTSRAFQPALRWSIGFPQSNAQFGLAVVRLRLQVPES